MQLMEMIQLLMVPILVVTLCLLGFSQAHRISDRISVEYTGSPGEFIEVRSPNYLAETRHELKSDRLQYHALKAYDMNKPTIYSSTFHNTNGRIRLKFLEYDLHPSSLIYMYDGANSSARGSLWTSESNTPVYVSTGASLSLVFKTGHADQENIHMGFVAVVHFVGEEEWTNMPSTGICAPFQNYLNGSWTVVKSSNVSTEIPVYCSYTCHLRGQNYLFTFEEFENDNDIQVFDFPSATVGNNLSHYETGLFTKNNNGTWISYLYKFYNISSAALGYHLLLQPNFTQSDHVVMVTTGRTEQEAQDIAKFLMDTQPDLDFDFCPYKNCANASSESPQCTDYWASCSLAEQLDATCDFYTAGSRDLYAVCGNGSRCYNRIVDTCDGLNDCVGNPGEDETHCSILKPKLSLNSLIIIPFAVIIICILIFVAVLFRYCSRNILQCCIRCVCKKRSDTPTYINMSDIS